MVKKIIRLYLILTGLVAFGMGLSLAIYATFLVSHGLSLFQINMVNLVYFTTLLLCEVPTGAFADLFGRRKSFILSCFVRATGLFVYSATGSFWGFALAEFIVAIGGTFSSGAFDSWAIDMLYHHGYTGTKVEITTKENRVHTAAHIIGGLVGAFIASYYGAQATFLIGGIIILSCGLLAIVTMKEEYFQREKSSKGHLESLGNKVSTCMKEARGNQAIRFILVVGFLQIMFLKNIDMQWQVLFVDKLPDQKYLGIMWAVMSFGLLIGASLTPSFLNWMKRDERKSLVLIQILIGTLIVATVLPQSNYLMLAMFILHEIPRGMWKPLKMAYLQDNITSKDRATMSSFESLSGHAGGMFGLLVGGIISLYLDIRTSWIIFGTTMVISAILVHRNVSKKK